MSLHRVVCLSPDWDQTSGSGSGSGSVKPDSPTQLHQAVVQGQGLDDGGVGLGALLELLQSQLPISILGKKKQRKMN